MSGIDSLPLLLDGLLPKLLGARVPARRQGFEAHQLIAVEDAQFAAAIHDPQFAAARTLAPEDGLAAVWCIPALYHAARNRDRTEEPVRRMGELGNRQPPQVRRF